MSQRRSAILSCASVAIIAIFQVTSAARVLSSSSIITTATATGAVVTSVNGASDSAAASTSTAKTETPFEQYYKELCLPPKSCTTKRSERGTSAYCSYNTLRGLATTRQNMQARQQSISEHPPDNISFEALTAMNMHLSSVRSEEASVGCALLVHYHHSAGKNNIVDYDPESMISTNFIETVLKRAVRDTGDGKNAASMICPGPNSCSIYPENEDGKPKCDDQHLIQLKSLRDDQEGYLSSGKADDDIVLSDTERMARQAELDVTRAEIAAVGCILMLEHQVKEKRRRETAAADSNNSQYVTTTPAPASDQNDSNSNKQLGIILNPTFEQILKDEEHFDFFLQQNYHRCKSTIKLEHLVNSYEAIQTKRTKIELVLSAAGRGDIPDIIWQERLSRERAVERLKDQEAAAQRQLFVMLQRRIDEGYFKISDLDTRKESARPDDRNIWDRIAERMEQEETEKAQQRSREVADLEAKEKEKKKMQRVPGAPTASSQECNHIDNTGSNDDNESGTPASSCTPDSVSLSPASQLMIDRMKKDMELLRQKAKEAFSEEERNARLSMVQEMERQLKNYLSDVE